MAYSDILDFLFVLLKDLPTMDAAVIPPVPVLVNVMEIVPAAFSVVK